MLCLFALLLQHLDEYTPMAKFFTVPYQVLPHLEVQAPAAPCLPRISTPATARLLQLPRHRATDDALSRCRCARLTQWRADGSLLPEEALEGIERYTCVISHSSSNGLVS
jgi:hypothetical protein